ncbi:MAG: hypothetical protein HC782_04250 [Gammaproteobacteria bacterium]|nr:hypothetical protein [Gammaproteobacteria bacterium]
MPLVNALRRGNLNQLRSWMDNRLQAAAAILSTIQSPSTLDLLDELQREGELRGRASRMVEIPTLDELRTVLDQLAKRPSLGWTNLDKTFAAVVPRLKEHTQVIYVGDGITTTGDADPVAFAARLKLMMAGKQGTFHAVATSSSYESAVLAAMASLGLPAWPGSGASSRRSSRRTRRASACPRSCSAR